MTVVEATYDARRAGWFANFFADSVLVYYLVAVLGGTMKPERRRAARA